MKSSIDTLLVTNGASHAQFLALASLVSPGDTVLCDSITDHGVIGSAQVLGFTLKGLDSDEYGIQPDHFEDMCRALAANAIHPVVDQTFPLGDARAAFRLMERGGHFGKIVISI